MGGTIKKTPCSIKATPCNIFSCSVCQLDIESDGARCNNLNDKIMEFVQFLILSCWRRLRRGRMMLQCAFPFYLGVDGDPPKLTTANEV